MILPSYNSSKTSTRRREREIRRNDIFYVLSTTFAVCKQRSTYVIKNLIKIVVKVR